MAVLTAVMVVEKTTPGGDGSVPAVGWALIASGGLALALPLLGA